MAPHANMAEGYAWFLSSQLKHKDVVVLVAERGGAIIGYVYAGLEPTSWKELREACGFIHDVVVEESSRRMGVARAAFGSGHRVASSARRPSRNAMDR